MEAFITYLFPVSIPLWQALGLVAFSFFTSFLAASAGIGGGTAMMGVMANIIPINVLVAVHGFVQLGSNTGRAYLQRAHVDWGTVRKFVIGGIFGAALGGLFFVNMPARILMLVLGLFILWMVWGPKVKLPGSERWGMVAVGAFAVFCAMFIGAMGPFVNSVLQRKGFERHKLIATQAACLVMQHALKVIVFLILGVKLREWAGMIGLMIVTGFMGTYVGTYVLKKIPEHAFQVILKIVLSVSALALLYKAADFKF
jgi:uncharacterized membrane protein YfcA